MKKRLNVALLGLLFVCGCAKREKVPVGSMPAGTQPLRFLPSAEKSRGGASVTALVPAPGRPGALWLRAEAGLGDTFPVREQGGPTLFEVAVVEGNDVHLVLEVRSGKDSRRVSVPRDVPKKLDVAGATYEFYYPTCHVSSKDWPVTSKVLIMVTRLP